MYVPSGIFIKGFFSFIQEPEDSHHNHVHFNDNVEGQSDFAYYNEWKTYSTIIYINIYILLK